MPIYEYECASCGEQLESIQKISDPPLTECPACKQPALRKLVSAAAFHLKGSGWYVTDFKDKSAAKDKSDSKDNKTTPKTASPAADSAKTESSKSTDTASSKTAAPKAEKTGQS